MSSNLVRTGYGVLRRLFRASLFRQVRRNKIHRRPGKSHMWGYGYTMEYPDKLIWANQILEIVASDCYGIRKLPEEPRVVDGGANIGTFTLYVLWRRPLARIIVIEPFPANVDYLYRNLRQVVDSHVSREEVAIGLTSGTTRIGGETSDSARTGVDHGEEVVSRPLADYLSLPTDLLKLNIEGAEIWALESAGSSLRNVRRAVIAYHALPDGDKGLPYIMELLATQGLDRFRVYGNREFSQILPSDLGHGCFVEAWRQP